MNISEKFEKINLQTISQIPLLERRDTKFMCHIDKLDLVLQGLSSDWKVLSVNNNVVQNYYSEYFDTKGFTNYYEHHNKIRPRKKIRFRRYGKTPSGFFEVKKKLSNNITKKYRHPVKEFSINENLKKYLEQVLATDSLEKFEKKIIIEYKRVSFYNLLTQEKITIDNDIYFRSGNKSEKFEKVLIIELKQNRFSDNKSIFRLLRKNNIKKEGISKYCLGLNVCNPDLKNNLFKVRNKRFLNIERV